jgi:asparagine synthase (glutamine-hydrolysing)
VPLYYVSRLARESGVPVIQVGEGSDELFCGYPKFKLALRLNPAWNALQMLPDAFWRGGYRVSAGILEKQGRLLAREHLRRLGSGERLFWGGAMAFMEYQKRLLLSDEMLTQCAKLSTSKFIDSVYAHANGDTDSPLRAMTYLELKQRLPELLLMRVDKMAMANSIETRVPFLDHKLVEYALSLPAELQLKNGTLKYLLKEAVRGLVPGEIIDRKKLGFCGSARNMLSRKVSEYSYNVIQEALPELETTFNGEYVQKVIARHQRGDNQGMRLWNLLNFALWYRCWISKRVTV